MPPGSPRILVIDSNTSDLALATRVLDSDLPTAEIVPINENAALLAGLTTAAVDIAVVAASIAWCPTRDVIALLNQHSAKTAVILFGNESDIVDICLDPGRALAGVVRKNSAGFVALSEIVRAAFRERERGRPADCDVLALPIAAFVARGDGFITRTNEPFSSHYGGAEKRLQRADIGSLCADANSAEMWTAFMAGNAINTELRLRFDNTGTRHVRLQRNLTSLPDERLLAVVLDRPAAEITAVAPREQQQSSREMHDIALVFSHDLKEPVQQIMRLVRRLEDGSARDELGTRNKLTQQLHTCAERASGMLDGMLEYLAVSARDEQPGLVDLGECLERALDNLRVTIDESEAHIVSDSLPSVAGDAYQLVHLFQNLVSNAIKFRAHQKPQIRISASCENNVWWIAFQDNGIGIAEQFRDRVFEMGKRLHTRDEYPGGGIGLTLCRRIVERHGGSIHIEAAENGGSVVVVGLPRPPDQVTRFA